MSEAAFTIYLSMGTYFVGYLDCDGWDGFPVWKRELARISILFAWPAYTMIYFIVRIIK